MSRIIAAVDQSPAAAPVMRAALALAPLFGASVEAVTVREDGTGFAEAAAAEAGLELHVLEGSPADRIIDAIDDPDVAAAVLGTRRRPTGPRPAGSTALRVLERVRKPVVVVPPEWHARGSFGRAVVPLDAATETSLAIKEVMGACACNGLEILVVHVFSEESVPRFWDRPAYEDEEWAREFLSRHCAEPGAHVELRIGSPAREVLEVARGATDLVLLAWSQDLSGGRAQLVREVLADSPVPVMLVPIPGAEEIAA